MEDDLSSLIADLLRDYAKAHPEELIVEVKFKPNSNEMLVTTKAGWAIVKVKEV